MLDCRGDQPAGERRIAQPVEHGTALGRELAMGLDERQRLPIHRLGVLVGEQPLRAHARAYQVVQRLAVIAAAPVVTREIVQHLVEPIGVEPLQRTSRRRVQLGPRLEQQAAIGDVANQSLREGEPQLRKELLLVQQLQGDELGHRRVGVLTRGRDRLQQADREFPAQHRRALQRALQRLSQAVDARREQIVNRLRNGFFRARRPPLALAQIAGELLDEERVPFGARHHPIVERARFA